MAKIDLNEADCQMFRQELSVNIESNNLRSALKYIQPKPYWEKYKHRKYYAIAFSIAFPVLNTILGHAGVSTFLIKTAGIHSEILANMIGIAVPILCELAQYSFMKPMNQNRALGKPIDTQEIIDFIFFSLFITVCSGYGLFLQINSKYDFSSSIIIAGLISSLVTYITYHANYSMAMFAVKSKLWIVDNKSKLKLDQFDLFDSDEYDPEKNVSFKKRDENRPKIKTIEIQPEEVQQKAIESKRIEVAAIDETPKKTEVNPTLNDTKRKVINVFKWYDNQQNEAIDENRTPEKPSDENRHSFDNQYIINGVDTRKKCKQCSALFASNHKKQVYCCDDCRKTASKARKLTANA